MTTINEWREYSTTVLAHKRYCKTWYRLTTAMSHQAQPKCYCSDRIEGDNASPNRWPGAPHLLPRVPSLTAVVPASSTPKLKDSCPSAPTPPPPTLSSPLAPPPWTDRVTPFYCRFSSVDELRPTRSSSTLHPARESSPASLCSSKVASSG
jgi:hypothetical protein